MLHGTIDYVQDLGADRAAEATGLPSQEHYRWVNQIT